MVLAFIFSDGLAPFCLRTTRWLWNLTCCSLLRLSYAARAVDGMCTLHRSQLDLTRHLPIFSFFPTAILRFFQLHYSTWRWQVFIVILTFVLRCFLAPLWAFGVSYVSVGDVHVLSAIGCKLNQQPQRWRHDWPLARADGFTFRLDKWRGAKKHPKVNDSFAQRWFLERTSIFEALHFVIFQNAGFSQSKTCFIAPWNYLGLGWLLKDDM